METLEQGNEPASNCCEIIPRCSTFSCPTGFGLKAGQDAEATQQGDNPIDTCCEVQKCIANTVNINCANTHILKENPNTNLQISQESPSATPEINCCQPRTCSKFSAPEEARNWETAAYTCPSTSANKVGFNDIPVPDPTTVNNTCCDVKMCSGNTNESVPDHTCANTHILKLNSSGIEQTTDPETSCCRWCRR